MNDRPMPRPRITLGMPCFDDFDGVYFSVQALRQYHAEVIDDAEIVVVDNHPDSPAGQAVKDFIAKSVPNGRYIPFTEFDGPALSKDCVFRRAHGEYVVCMDAHVFLVPGALRRLLEFYENHPDCNDLIQGPLLNDNGTTVSTHMDPVWRSDMLGIWACDDRGVNPQAVPFEIPMHGCGMMSCRKQAWLGFHPSFRGFGGEEGYIHEKYRQHGRRTLCLPFLRWLHRFGRPGGVPYQVSLDDRLRNYLLGRVDLRQSVDDVLEHFGPLMKRQQLEKILEDVGLPPLRHFKLSKELAEVMDSDPDSIPAEALDSAANASLRLPLVSCIMPTYNRFPAGQTLVEEAVASFLKQDYLNKELIILNDCPGQTLEFDHPQVSVVNVAKRFRSLGEKHNALAALSNGDLICPWDDDDISLPWRISMSVAHLGNSHYWTAKGYWFWDGRLHLGHRFGYAHNQSIYTREMFDRIKGYPHSPVAQDAAILPDFNHQDVATQGKPIHPSNWYYIYRWNTGSYHGSGHGPDGYRIIGDISVKTGKYAIKPHWQSEYTLLTKGMVADACQKKQLEMPEPPARRAA